MYTVPVIGPDINVRPPHFDFPPVSTLQRLDYLKCGVQK